MHRRLVHTVCCLLSALAAAALLYAQEPQKKKEGDDGKVHLISAQSAQLIEDKDGQIAVSIRYNDAIYTNEYMTTLAECIKVCTENIMSDLNADVSHLSLLSEKETEIIKNFETSQIVPTPFGLLHKMFEASAAANSDKTALIACDKTLTYSELDRQINITANNLIEKGVLPRGKVALLLPRRSFYFVAMFAVLKAGAAFIPCDPEYPAARINHIISDSDAKSY